MLKFEVRLLSISAFSYRDMRQWCMENIGKDGTTWTSWSKCDSLNPHDMMQWHGSALFAFDDSEDAMMFKLKFGG